MKTKGYLNSDGLKNFTITYQGEEFDCERSGQRFVCRGFKGTIKAIKAEIEAGNLDEVEDEFEDDTVEEFKTADDYETELGCQPEYQCIDPCALLIRYGDTSNREVIHTLDMLGWLEDDGVTIDNGRAQREIDRYTKTNQQKQITDDI